ncbi:MAG TPA: ATPase, T2SS/T4P/T4SS family [Nevskiaceae bacterium]|nr:ATPase, T2SS/T4P/T4SS family [Nevskiaceae bacterium]
MSQPPVPAPKPARTGVGWPVPPFFYRDSRTPSQNGLACQLERTDGSVLEGRLSLFQPEADQIGVQAEGGEQAVKVNLAQLRILRLRDPQALLRDEQAAQGVGNPSAIPNDLPYALTLDDGTRLEGRTRGFVRKPCGLFLFTVGKDESVTLPCFVPAHQVRSLDIGALLGQTLADRHEISDRTLSAALKKQADLRDKKIGHYLADRGILTAAELAGALERLHRKPRVKLGELLLAEKLITNDQLDEALATQKKDRSRRIGDILIDMGAVTIRTIQIALSDKLGIPFVNVREFPIDPVTLGLLPASVAVRRQALPLLQRDDRLVVAVENPLAGDSTTDLQFASGLNIVPVIADPGDLQARIALEYLSAMRAQEMGLVNDAGHVTELAEQLAREAPTGEIDTRARAVDLQVNDNTLVRLVNKVILDAAAQGASDIHIESNPGKQNTRIRFRRDGDLIEYLELPPAYRAAVVSRIKVMADLDIAERRQAQDGKIDFARFGPLPLELRVTIIPTANNLEDVVLRLLGVAEALPIDKIGLTETDLADIKRMANRTYGLFLVCGPTGSGKTTTLHSILHEINRPDLKIWTAEDPVEITQRGLRQVQINSRIGWTFANAMRSFLRADPDVIMVGEMRDAETAKIGIEASLTGHLVFSTLHTNSAAESVTRLLDLGMDPFNFADALIGVCSQRLARRLCPACKKTRVLSEPELAEIAGDYCAGNATMNPKVVIDEWRHTYGRGGKVAICEPVGCRQCNDGWKGRLGVFELLRADAEIKHRVHTRAATPLILEAARAAGMRSLRQDALTKVLQGELDLRGARAVAD